MKNGKLMLFSDHTIPTRNGVIAVYPNLLPYEMDPQVRGYVEWNFMSVDQVSHSPQRIVLAVALQAGKADLPLELVSVRSKDEPVTLLGWKGPSI